MNLPLFKRLRWGPCLLALVVAALGWFLHEFAIGSGLANLSYDLLHLLRGDHIPANDVVIIYLDEKSHLDLQRPQNRPWDRAIHARMLDRLTQAGAKAVVMDIVFSDASTDGPEADQRLAEAMRRNGRVIIGADHVPVGEFEKIFVPPIELFATNAADFGSVEMWTSRDLTVRAQAPNEQLPSMSWAAARLLSAPITKATEPETFQPSIDTGNPKVWVHYYGRPDWLPHVRYSDALDRSQVPDSMFKGKVVFIGGRMITKLQNERNDSYRNPYSLLTTGKGEKPFIWGVEIQATQFLNLMGGDWLRRLPWSAELWIILAVGVVSGFGLMRLRPGAAIAAAILALLAVSVLSRVLFLGKLTWFPWLILFVQISFALICAVAANSVRLYVENKLFEHSLQLYLSPKLVKKFASDKDRTLLKPGAEKQTLTILFSDIENFTALSERMDSDDLAKMMNEYFQAAVGNCIHSTDGTVVKYIGDAIFAFWNAPEPQIDHAARACEAALRFRDQNGREFRGHKLITRIGLHTGVANVGNFGSESRVDYTAIGESINLASRMEGLNKHLGTEVLITAETRKEIGDQFITRYLGKFQLKGFERSVEVYELLGKQEPGTQVRRQEEFDSALRLFQQRDLSAAENAFQRMLETQPEDGATQFYRKHVAEVRNQGVPENWNGEVELKEK